MPRKAWNKKNRYCWNANLSEEMFLVLLRLYCTGYTCSQAARVISRYSCRFSRKKISRQTVNRYYLMLGDYQYELLPDALKIENVALEPDDDAPANKQEQQRYNANVILTALHRVLYEKLEWSDDINQILIGRRMEPVFDILKAFSKTKRGYPIETFNAHFAYGLWFFLIQQIRPGEPPWKALYDLMKETLETDPLDARYNRSLRIIKTEQSEHPAI